MPLHRILIATPHPKGRLHSLAAIAAGAGMGAALVTLWIAATVPAVVPAGALIVFVVSFLGWLVGILVLGVPPWGLTIWLRLDGLATSLVTGAVAPALGLLGMSQANSSPIDAETVRMVGLFAVAGAVVGLTIWLVAYRPWKAAP